MREMDNHTLVYGAIVELDGEGVFVPKNRAEELAEIHNAKDTATTWQELFERIPTDVFTQLVAYEFDLDVEAFDEIEADERQRILAQPFDAGDVGLTADGDWPAWAPQETLDWMPRNIRQRLGHRHTTNFNGDYLTIDGRQVKETVAALEAAGYACSEHVDLVRRASGFGS